MRWFTWLAASFDVLAQTKRMYTLYNSVPQKNVEFIAKNL
jgi:hypothetical protein